jgi:hypothetical protein
MTFLIGSTALPRFLPEAAAAVVPRQTLTRRAGDDFVRIIAEEWIAVLDKPNSFRPLCVDLGSSCE